MKKFLRTLTIALAVALTLATVACSTTAFDDIVAVAVPALTNILNIVAISNGTPFNSGLAAKIATDAADLKQVGNDLINNVNAAGSTCQKFTAALNTFTADEQSVLQIAQVGDSKTQTEIAELAALVVSTVDGIANAIPSCQATMARALAISTLQGAWMMGEGLRGGGSAPPSFPPRPAPSKTKAEFVARYNAILSAKHSQFKLHNHSKAVRALTLGKAN